MWLCTSFGVLLSARLGERLCMERIDVMSNQIEHHKPTLLKPWANNARTHSRKQLRQIADSIEEFGFTNPIIIDNDNVILAGHGRVEAAKQQS